MPLVFYCSVIASVVNKDLTFKAKDLTLKAKDLTLKAKDLTFKAKDSKFILEDTSRPRTKAKDNNTGYCQLKL